MSTHLYKIINIDSLLSLTARTCLQFGYADPVITDISCHDLTVSLSDVAKSYRKAHIPNPDVETLIDRLILCFPKKVSSQLPNDQFNAKLISSLASSFASLTYKLDNRPNILRAIEAFLSQMRLHRWHEQSRPIPSQHPAINNIWCLSSLGDRIDIDQVTVEVLAQLETFDLKRMYSIDVLKKVLWGLLILEARWYLQSFIDHRYDSVPDKIRFATRYLFNQVTQLYDHKNHTDRLLSQTQAWITGNIVDLPEYSQSSAYPTPLIAEAGQILIGRLKNRRPDLEITGGHQVPYLWCSLYFPRFDMYVRIAPPETYVGKDHETLNGRSLFLNALLNKSGYRIFFFPLEAAHNDKLMETYLNHLDRYLQLFDPSSK